MERVMFIVMSLNVVVAIVMDIYVVKVRVSCSGSVFVLMTVIGSIVVSIVVSIVMSIVMFFVMTI